MSKQKLELTWIGKEKRPKLEPRILLEDPEKSYHAKHRVTDNDIFDNRLIFGDNLLALKALEQEFSGKVKCVFIDPPYNTGSAFTHYDDGLEHSIWLGLMRDRLELIKRLLAEDGSLWITIDDNEAHYLKVLCDEVFGRANFVANIVWQSKDTPGNNASTIAQTHNMLLVFKKSDLWKPNLVPRSEKQIANYKNPDNDPRGPWLGTPLTRAEFRERDYYALTNDAGRQVLPPKRQFLAASSGRNQEAPKGEAHLLGKRWQRRIPCREEVSVGSERRRGASNLVAIRLCRQHSKCQCRDEGHICW
ncbi:site-specific DNA-methyltransferase [Stenotrophomonas maltophilia]|uniref:site-specific DNA-methyltransferase n=1 Tax=Stenotrophomonas maltophilia TaxID=40324 RepID=UPI003D18C7E4